MLYVADTGNHAIRAIDLAAHQVATIAGIPETRGNFGDGGPATSAGLFGPQAVVACGGDLFVADTGNNRVRRIAHGSNTITTVLGAGGLAASTGEGAPARALPVDAPRGLACDASGNVLATSTDTVRLLAADDAHVVDGSGPVTTIFASSKARCRPAASQASW